MESNRLATVVESHHTAGIAFQCILRHNLEHLYAFEAAAHSWHHPEGVHQVRVALRRMRSAFCVFRRAVPRPVGAPWEARMQELAGRLGPARDLDVFITETLAEVRNLLPLPGGERLAELAQRRRVAAYDRVRAMLDGRLYHEFKDELNRWIETRGWERHGDDPLVRAQMTQEVVPFARQVLDRQERRVLDVGTHVDRHDARQMHRLRIACKKLRYATQFFAPLFDGMDGFIEHTKHLQDLLGEMNDTAVMGALIGQILDGVDEAEVEAYAGGVVGWRAHRTQVLLESFDARWDAFVETLHPWWKKASWLSADARSPSRLPPDGVAPGAIPATN